MPLSTGNGLERRKPPRPHLQAQSPKHPGAKKASELGCWDSGGLIDSGAGSPRTCVEVEQPRGGRFSTMIETAQISLTPNSLRSNFHEDLRNIWVLKGLRVSAGQDIHPAAWIFVEHSGSDQEAAGGAASNAFAFVCDAYTNLLLFFFFPERGDCTSCHCGRAYGHYC